MQNIDRDKLEITEELISKVAQDIYYAIHSVESIRIDSCKHESDKYALAAYHVICSIDDHMPTWPHSKIYFHEINADMAGYVLDDITHILDGMGVPKGTFGDEQIKNLIVSYNDRGKLIASLEKRANAITVDDQLAAMQDQINALSKTLIDLANWPEHEFSHKEMTWVAAGMVDPSLVKNLQGLLNE
jgi:hypothetical protein